MDANTNKTIASVFATLMVSTVFLAAITPTAEAGHLSGGSTDVVIDVRQGTTSVTFFNGTNIAFGQNWVPTTPSAFKMRAKTAYDLTFIGLNTGATSGGYGYTGTGSTTGVGVEIVNASSGVAVVPAQALQQGPDGTNGVLRNASFIIVPSFFEGPGQYNLRLVTGLNTPTPTSGAVIGSFVVYPNDDITVTVSTNPGTLTWTGNNVVVSVNTGVLSTISSNAPSLVTGSPNTDSTGFYPFPTSLPMGAGTWTIYATHTTNTGRACFGTAQAEPCATGSGMGSIPERMGNTTLVVGSTSLNVAAVATSAFSGFANTVTYTPTFASTGNAVFRNTPTEATVTMGNFSILTPTNFMYIWNGTVGTNNVLTAFQSLATSGPVWCQDRTQSTMAVPVLCSTLSGAATPPTVSIDTTTGRISVTNNTWQSGTYTFNIGLEADGTTDACGAVNSAPTSSACAAPEYLASWTLSPATPSAVTLASTPSTVDVPYADDNLPNNVGGSGGVAGGITTLNPVSAGVGWVNLPFTVSGSTINEHPYCRIRGPADATNNPNALVGTCDPTASGFTSSTTPTLLSLSERIERPDGSFTGCDGTAGANHCFTDNITLRGDVLPGWKVLDYTPNTGIANLRFTPARNGTIWIDVNWKNTTSTYALPVIKGSNITSSITNMTVDATTTFTVNVRNAFGGAVENANVYLFQRNRATDGTYTAGSFAGTGATFIAGSGAANAGQGGTYQFSIKPSAVQDLAVYTEVGTGANTNASYVLLTVLPSQTLNVNPNVTQIMAGQRTPLMLNVSNATGIGVTGTAGTFRAYLLNPVQVRDLLANGTTGLFTSANAPLTTGANTNTTAAMGTLFADSQNAAAFFTNVTLREVNDYRLYVCSSASAITDCRTATHDNRQNMPVVNVSAYNVAFTPTQIASSSDIEANRQIGLTVTDRAGALVNGSIRVRASDRTLVTSASPAGATTDAGTAVTNGQANITLTGTGNIGNIWWEFNPSELSGTQTDVWGQTNGNLSVVAGNLNITPSKVPILQSTLVTVKLENFTGAGLGGRIIRLCSASLNSAWNTGSSTIPTTLTTGPLTDNCPAVGTTEGDGSAGIVVTPTSLNPINVYINNSYTGRQIPVTAGTLVVTVSPTNPAAGQTVTITAAQPGGAVGAGIRVIVLRDGTGVLDQNTDANGHVTLASVTAGNYTVTASRSGFDNGTASFRVGATPPTGAIFELRNLVLPDRVNVGSPVTVSVDVYNTGSASGTATAQLLVNNAQRDTQSVTVGAGNHTTVAYTFTPTVAGTYAVTVKIGDVTIGPQDIVVGPVATPTSTPTTSPTTSPTTTPTVTPTTSPTASPTVTPTETEPTVPGFEVVALLAALGVALLVLRRKN